MNCGFISDRELIKLALISLTPGHIIAMPYYPAGINERLKVHEPFS